MQNRLCLAVTLLLFGVIALTGVGLWLDLNPAPRAPVPQSRPQIEHTKPTLEAPAQYEVRLAQIKRNVTCLAVLVYTEARGEPIDGQYLVAWVGFQRYLDQRPDFGRGTLCDVVYRELKTKDGYRAQFAGPVYWGDRVNRRSYAYRRAFYIALKVYGGEWIAPEKYRLARYFYHPETSDTVGGQWHKTALIPIDRVGGHVFSRDKETVRVPPRTPQLLLADT